jgi:hypothetical protein
MKIALTRVSLDLIRECDAGQPKRVVLVVHTIDASSLGLGNPTFNQGKLQTVLRRGGGSRPDHSSVGFRTLDYLSS